MRNLRKIIKEEIDDFDWIKDVPSTYKLCGRFTKKNENQLCKNLNSLKNFLVKDLGLREVIDNALDAIREINDLNDQYQEPMGVLYNTGKYNNMIKVVNGKYFNERLVNAGIVKDKNGNYDYVNKLNTNYSDLAELLTDLFIRGNQVDKLVNKNILGLKDYLKSIKGSLSKLIEKYYEVDELRDFVYNTTHLTNIGDAAEQKALEILEKAGFNKLYQGSNGDFIDMLFGIDLIMEYKGKVKTCQVKSSEKALDSAMSNGYYGKIDYFIAPTKQGIVVKQLNGKVTYIHYNGTITQG